MQKFLVYQSLLVASLTWDHMLFPSTKVNLTHFSKRLKNIRHISRKNSLPQPNELTFCKAEQ